MSDWINIDHDSPELAAYVAELVAQSRQDATQMLDDEGIPADHPGRLRVLALVEETHTRLIGRRLAEIRARVALERAAQP